MSVSTKHFSTCINSTRTENTYIVAFSKEVKCKSISFCGCEKKRKIKNKDDVLYHMLDMYIQNGTIRKNLTEYKWAQRFSMAFLGGKMKSKVLIHMANVFNRYNNSCSWRRSKYSKGPKERKRRGVFWMSVWTKVTN